MAWCPDVNLSDTAKLIGSTLYSDPCLRYLVVGLKYNGSEESYDRGDHQSEQRWRVHLFEKDKSLSHISHTIPCVLAAAIAPLLAHDMMHARYLERGAEYEKRVPRELNSSIKIISSSSSNSRLY